MVGHDHQCLRQKGPGWPLDHVLRARRSGRTIVILTRQLALKRPEQLRRALNVAGVLEQPLTPFRGLETGAPDLFQTRSTDRPIWTLSKIDKRSPETGIDAGQGGTPMRGVPPCQPSGRQDLNLRPLDPQRRPATPPTCGTVDLQVTAVQFDHVQRTSTQPDAGRCSRSAPEVPVNESHRAPGRARHGSRLR